MKKLASSLGLILALGLVITPQGCGGAPLTLTVPGSVAQELRDCAAPHSHHLGSAAHVVSFDVELSEGGEVESLALRDSTLDDRDLERCMATALRSLSEDDLPLRRSEDQSREPVSPQARALLGEPHAIALCLAAPPCWLTVAFFMGASYITVQLYVRATAAHQPPVSKPQFRKPPTPAPAPPPAGDPNTTGPTPPIPPPPPECPRNESFSPEDTHNSTGCTDKKGNLRCYSRRHPPCEGVHTHGRLKYQEIRRDICVEVDKEAVRCDGPFKVAGPCGSVSTVECGTEGWVSAGIFVLK